MKNQKRNVMKPGSEIGDMKIKMGLQNVKLIQCNVTLSRCSQKEISQIRVSQLFKMLAKLTFLYNL